MAGPQLPFAVGHAQAAPVPRFTPAEIRELANELTPEDIAKMHPQDQKVAQSILSSGEGLPLGDMGDPSLMYQNETFGSQVGPAAIMLGGAGLGEALPIAAGATKALQMGKAAVPGMVGAAGYGLLYGALRKAGMPAEAANAILIGLGLSKAGAKAAPAAAEGVAAEEAAVAEAVRKRYGSAPPELVDKIMKAERGAGAGASAASRAPGSNVIREGSQTGVYADVAGGVQNDFRGRVSMPDRNAGRVADLSGLDRALEGEMKYINGLKKGSRDAKYNSYMTSQEAATPQTTNMEELLAALAQSLGGKK